MLSRIRGLMNYRGFHVFTRPYELNIVGLRNKNTEPNRFDDELHVFYKTNFVNWEYHIFRATTDPGTYWLRNPLNPQGTAILTEGQYLNAYQLGLHRGEYKALVQVRPVQVLRDYDRDAVLDFYNGKKEYGLFGINIHRANRTGTTLTVDRNSAGCQVLENANGFSELMKLCELHHEKYGNTFTYSLIDFRTVLKRRRKIILTTAAALATAGFAGHLYFEQQYKRQISYG